MRRRNQGIDSIAFPPLTEDNCKHFEEASRARDMRMPLAKVLCNACPDAEGCLYREAVAAAFDSPHSVVTHAKVVVAPDPLTRDRSYIVIEDHALDLLRPTITVRYGLRTVRWLADFGAATSRRVEDRLFFRHFDRIAAMLQGWLARPFRPARPEGNRILDLPAPARQVPGDVYQALYRAAQQAPQPPVGDALKLVLAATVGELDRLAVFTDFIGTKPRTCLVGIARTPLPATAKVVINDCTTPHADIKAVSEWPVRDITPAGRLARQHPVIQWVLRQDVIKGTGLPDKAWKIDLARGILHDLPQFERVGLITHKALAERLQKRLEEPYHSQLANGIVSHFHGPIARGSNSWMDDCDCLLIIGTPRGPASAVRTHLLRLDKTEASCMGKDQHGWDPVTREYTDPRWRDASRFLIRSELEQCIGRGRGIMKTGIPTYAVTTQALGDVVDVADRPALPLSQALLDVWTALAQRDGVPLEPGDRRSVSELARELGKAKSTIYELLGKLELAGRAQRVEKGAGLRKGWVAAPRGEIVRHTLIYPYKGVPNNGPQPRPAAAPSQRRRSGQRPEFDDSDLHSPPGHPEAVGFHERRRREKRARARERARRDPSRG